MTTRIFLSVFLFSFLPHFLFSQIAEGTTFKKRRTYACQSLNDMSEGGVLIVRLTSNNRKIEQLEMMIKGKGGSKKRKKKYAEELKDLKSETKKENEQLVEAFYAEYDFSELLFMYDISTPQLSEGKQYGYFLKNNLEVDSTIDLANRKYRLVRYGFPTEPGQKRTKGLVVMDEQYQDMLPPFPYKSFLPREKEAKGEAEKEAEKLAHLKKLVDDMNRNFNQYLAKCKYKGWMTEED
jgi:hypothetical protein